MKVIVIGGGIISNKLVSTAPSYINITCFGIRSLFDSAESWPDLITNCKDADIIVYLAYHHRDFFKNLRLLGKVLSTLNNFGWPGRFIFFNSQSSIADEILRMKSSRAVRKFFSFNLYTVTKRIQSWILSRYSRYIFISEVYLPVVLGFETKAQKRYDSISRCMTVYLPGRGLNSFAYIELDLFLKWFWETFLNRLNGANIGHEYRKLFVYQGVRTFSEMIGILHASNFKAGKSLTSEYLPLAIDDCVHRFRFSNDFFSNLVLCLRMSPFWFLLSVLHCEFSKMRSVKKVSDVAPYSSDLIETCFVPFGPEYQYFSTSIDMNAIPFYKLRVGV